MIKGRGYLQNSQRSKSQFEQSLEMLLSSLCVLVAASASCFLAEADTIPSLCSLESTDITSGQWKVVLNEEFDGDKLNSSLWTARTTAEVGHENELQYYLPQNAEVSEGFLVISSLQQDKNGKNYTSAWVDSSGKLGVQYGRVCVRAMLPANRSGFWPAHWMMPAVAEACWPGLGEVDILEMLNGDGGAHGSYHYSQYYADDKCSGVQQTSTGVGVLGDRTFDGGFHEYAVEWSADKLTFYVDSRPYLSTYPTDKYNEGVPHVPMFLILNSALGGWAGPVHADTAFPIQHVVDYVRVLQDTSESQSRFVTPGETPADEELAADQRRVLKERHRSRQQHFGMRN
ncbi:beta-glucanase-like [Sycon ciliatum]|uniref:beta-glucanase-like n=1 Tax=Sycon ciliatum TaxID=27933 RepID=UPI0031F642B8